MEWKGEVFAFEEVSLGRGIVFPSRLLLPFLVGGGFRTEVKKEDRANGANFEGRK